MKCRLVEQKRLLSKTLLHEFSRSVVQLFFFQGNISQNIDYLSANIKWKRKSLEFKVTNE